MIWLALTLAVLVYAAAYPVLVARTQRRSTKCALLTLLGMATWGIIAYAVTGIGYLMLFDPSFLCIEACGEVDTTPGEVAAAIAGLGAAGAAAWLAVAMRGPVAESSEQPSPALW